MRVQFPPAALKYGTKMKITQGEFDRQFSQGRLRLCVIGMSNVGKTRRAKSLVADPSLSFLWLNCDDLVEARLRPYLEGKGFRGVDGVAAWMGQPYEPRYPETQALCELCRVSKSLGHQVSLAPARRIAVVPLRHDLITARVHSCGG